MNRKLLYAGTSFLVLVIVAFILVRHYNTEINVLTGRLVEAKAARVEKERLLALAQQRTAEAEKQADLVKTAEEAKRKPLEDQNRILESENAKLKKAEADRRQQQADQVETIPKMEDQELATKTTGALESAYPGNSPTIFPQPANNISAFSLNRPAVELSLRAAWEAVSSRQSVIRYQDQVANCETRAANNGALADSFHSELTAERSLTGALRAEVDSGKAVYDAALHEIELWKQKDKAQSRKGFWDRITPKVGPGVTVTVTPDGRIAYGFGVSAIYPIN